MRSTILMMTLCMAALSVGCTSAGGKSAGQTMQDHAYAKKAEFIAQMRKELVVIQGELNELSIKVEKTKGEAMKIAQVRLKEAQEKWAATEKQIELAQSASEETWDKMKSDLQKSVDHLKSTFHETRQWLSDKI